MKERGIPFSAAMVRVVLDDRKTQTRRTVKLPSWTASVTVDKGGTIWGPGPYLKAHRAEPVPDDVGAMERMHCPYGYPGDRLWVREAWRVEREHDALSGSDLDIDARWPEVFYECDDARIEAREDLGRYRHARFMPRWASRITLEITEVRAQRLQDISEADAYAEGFRAAFGPGFFHRTFDSLWDGINGDGAWAANPWVWAITFKRIDARAS